MAASSKKSGGCHCACGSPESQANAHVKAWIDECVAMCQPDKIVWCNGSLDERKAMFEQGVKDGVFIRLNQEKRPGCYLHRSNPNDVARTEHLTFICTPTKDEAGPTNNWMKDTDAYAKLKGLYTGCMKGRTMYVVPFVMGPVGSPLAKVGIELTDSLYVAVSMSIMTRMGDVAWKQLGDSDSFTRCLHSLGDVNPDRRFVCHFPQDNAIWSFGSGYGGNALLGKKCLALRLASYLGNKEGWMAEHMLLLCATSPEGEKTYVAAAFPSACGKTNFAMLEPPAHFKNWKITTIGDDIVWMYPNAKDGRLYAINPENGYFGVAPGTSDESNHNAMCSAARDTIFTNVAMTPDGDVWWEGMTKTAPAKLIDWQGKDWTPDCGRKAAHPNSRFTAPVVNNPVLDENVNNPEGVPVSALIFGGRRSTTMPLVYEAFNWIHGVFIGATLGSETTAAATGQVGIVRRDPMAMLPFIGYNVNQYFAHWFKMRKTLTDAPRIFSVNWFRKDDQGHFLWPGFGDNMRVLKWIIDRCKGRTGARETVLGWMPRENDVDLEGLDIDKTQFAALETVNVEDIKKEILSQQELFLKLGSDLPKEVLLQRELLISRL